MSTGSIGSGPGFGEILWEVTTGPLTNPNLVALSPTTYLPSAIEEEPYLKLRVRTRSIWPTQVIDSKSHYCKAIQIYSNPINLSVFSNLEKQTKT